jgi:predicted AlkP superfamily pyrophosphatase or phosphodiesterase
LNRRLQETEEAPEPQVRCVLKSLGRIVPALAATLLLSLPALGQTPNGAAAPAPRPKLIVVLVVDQMRADYIDRFRDEWHGGLRRIVDQGAWLRDAAYPYSSTETCPGHSTISTGVFPATSGIVGNTWYDRQTSSRVTCTEDSSLRKIAADHTAPGGDGPSRLLAPSFAEQLRAGVPGSRTVAISLKSRSAIMLAGHHADAVLWTDDSTGDLLTSSAYGDELPPFARQFVEANPLSAEFSKVWSLTMPPASYSNGGSIVGEGPPSGWTTSFPHPLSAGQKSPGRAVIGRWRTSPFSDEYLERLAEAAVVGMELGAGSGVDFLGIGFSATDYIGHAFGPDSREIEDNLLQLDKTIGTLLQKLDSTVGRDRYVVVLAADHGVAPVPERAEAQGRDAGRVDSVTLLARIDKALAARLGAGHYVAQLNASDLSFVPGIAERLDSDPSLWRAVQRAALAEPGVERIIRRKKLAMRSSDASARALALDFFPGRSGDAWIGLKPDWIFSARTKAGWAGGTTHGSPNAYDQRVPIVLFGAGVKPGRYTMPATPADIAPTLASISRVSIARTDGRILREALAQ